MTNKEKRYDITSLSVAGLVSFLSFLFGCVIVLGLSWMQHPLKDFVPYSLLLLEFPLFVLATVFSKRFIIPLWAMTVIYPLALILLARDIFIANSFMILVAGTGTISFPILATLLRHGTRFYSSPLGKLGELWQESKGVPYHRKF